MKKMLSKKDFRLLILRKSRTGNIVDQEYQHLGFTRQDVETELAQMEKEIEQGPSIADVLRFGAK